MKKAAVIIPNYNGLKFLVPCIEALDMQDTDDFVVCVVDNGSNDGSTAFLKGRPDIRSIFFDKNYGFCRAVNEGVKASPEKYVILLNNDTVPEKSFVSALIKAIEGRKKVFSVSSCMLTPDGSNTLDGAGDLYSALGWAFARGKGQDASRFSKECRIFSACGGAAIYRRELFVSLGLLDEIHFAYLEDMDLGFRARIRGYENIYTPGARVVHIGSGTTGSLHNEFKVRISARNNAYLLRKNMPAGMYVLNAPFLALGMLLKKVYFTRKGLGGAYSEGVREGRRLLSQNGNSDKKQKFRMAYLPNYIRIQFELWGSMFKRRS